MKKTIFLFMAIIAFLLPIGLTSCEEKETDDWKPATEMSLKVLKSDPTLKTFFTDGNYLQKTQIASFNYDGYGDCRYGNIGEKDSINEPSTPLYYLILNKNYIKTEDKQYFKGRYNFTLTCRERGHYAYLDYKEVKWIEFYRLYDIELPNITFIELLEKLLTEPIRDNKNLYRIDISVQNK